MGILGGFMDSGRAINFKKEIEKILPDLARLNQSEQKPTFDIRFAELTDNMEAYYDSMTTKGMKKTAIEMLYTGRKQIDYDLPNGAASTIAGFILFAVALKAEGHAQAHQDMIIFYETYIEKYII